MCLLWTEDKWKVTYYEDHEPTFDLFDSKDDVISFLEQYKEDNGGIPMNDICIYPPKVDITLNKLLTYGVPEFIVKEMER